MEREHSDSVLEVAIARDEGFGGDLGGDEVGGAKGIAETETRRPENIRGRVGDSIKLAFQVLFAIDCLVL